MTIAGCLYWALVISYYIVKFSQSPGGITWGSYGFAPFGIAFLMAAIAVWRKPRAGFITAVAVSGVTLPLVGPNLGIAQTLSADGLLAGGATANGILFVVLFFSLFGARSVWRKSNQEGVPPFKLGQKAVIGALIFLLLLVVAGEAFGTAQSTVVTTYAGQANIVIAPGSSFLTSDRFYLPQNFQAKVGQAVVWKNLDNAPHTVTSNTGLFASGNIDAGGVYNYTFKQPGTYYYSCDYHGWMVGSIVVSG